MREADVVEALVVRCLSAKVTARLLGTSHHTVARDRTIIFRKLSVDSVVQLAKLVHTGTR